MALGEAFTILAVLEANDRMSRVLEGVDGSLNRLSETALRAAETTMAAGERIDESLLKTASGADAGELAAAKLSAAQAKAATTAEAQANAERALLEAQSQAAAAGDSDVAATERLAAASDQLATAQKRAALAAKEEAAAADHAAAVGRAQAAAVGESTAATDAAAASQARMGATTERAAASGTLLSKGMGVAALGVAAISYASIKAAGNFESMTEHLVTDGGEAQNRIAMIRAGILQLATDTGTSTEQLSAGMLHIESAGFHAQAGLDVLKAAAQGAKVGSADLDTVGKALTGTLNAYSASGYSATQMMNMLIAATASGDMKMQDLASSLGNVAPTAAAAHIQLTQVLGAIATMTSQNMSAAQATQDLNHTIGSLQNPTTVQTKEMQAMGLSSVDVSSKLGSRGLTGTLNLLVGAIATHTKGGLVFQSTLKSSEVAAQNANLALKSLPPSIQSVAKGLLAGSVTTTAYSAAIKNLPVSQKSIAQQFETLAKKTGSFNDLLKSGSPAAQTMSAALAKMTGGTTGLQTALMLTGGRAKAFADNSANVAAVSQKAGTTVNDWDKIQGTFNQKMDRAKVSVEAAGISLGTALLPAVSAVAGAIADFLGPMASFLAQHQKLLGLLLAVIGPALAVVGIIKTIGMVTKLWAAAQLALDAAMDASPIGLLVIAIAALVGGLIYAYTHFKVFRDIVNDVFRVVKTVVMTYVDLIILEFKLLVGAAMLVWQGLEAAWNAVSAGVMALWHDLEGAWNSIVSVTTTVWNGIVDFFKKWWPLLLVIFLPAVAIVLAIWNHFHSQIIDTAKTVWNAVKTFFTTIWNTIVTLATGAWKIFQTVIIKPIEAVWAFLQPTFHAIASFLSGVWHTITSVATTMWNAIKAAIINPLVGAWHSVVSTVSNIAGAIGRGIQGAWNAVSGIASKFLSIGGDIISGIVQGVENAGSSLFGSVEKIASGALNAAKSFLGIGSPSREFAEQVGQWIPHGIAQGVTKYAAVAQKAVKGMSSSLLGAGSTGVASVSGGIGSSTGMAYAGGAGSLGQGGLTLHVHLEGAHFSSDRDVDAMTTKVGKKIVQQLAQAGVHIRA